MCPTYSRTISLRTVPYFPTSRQRFSPVFRYPLADVAAAVVCAPRGPDGARRVRYVNPLTGGPVMPFLDCTLAQLDPGQTTIPARTSAHAVCTIVAGTGETRIGDQRIAWETNDVFALPNGVATVHSATSSALLFVVSDRELYRRLDLLTEVYG
jgi:gentisate 1,2-dioxygenase